MSVVADLTLDALREHGMVTLVGYAACLRHACDGSPPPFETHWYGEKYRALATDSGWLAMSLLQNAQVEGEGSRKLWSLAGRCADPMIADLVRRHAVDESRHALLYLAMLNLSFPSAVDSDLKQQLKQVSPQFGLHDVPPSLPRSSDEWVLDELIQMNIGEIRTRIHQLLLRPMLNAHTASENRPALQRLLDSVLLDETKHIAYTARLIDAAVARGQGSFVESVMTQRVRDFNEITLQEVGEEEFVGE